jgi:hypothetical protein
MHLKYTMNKENYIAVFVIIFTLYSCQYKSDSSAPISSHEKSNFPLVVDTTNFSTKKRCATWLSTAHYEFLYIGKNKDTICVDYFMKHYPIPILPIGDEFSSEDTIGYYDMIIKT